MGQPARTGEPWGAHNEQYRAAIESAAEEFGVPDQILRNIARLETDWNPNPGANPRSSAAGMMQFIGREGDRSRWTTQGQFDRSDPHESIRQAAWYLRDIADTLYGTTLPDGTRGGSANVNWRNVVRGYRGENDVAYLNGAMRGVPGATDANTPWRQSEGWSLGLQQNNNPSWWNPLGQFFDSDQFNTGGQDFTSWMQDWSTFGGRPPGGNYEWIPGDTGVEVGAGGEPVPPLEFGTPWGFPTDGPDSISGSGGVDQNDTGLGYWGFPRGGATDDYIGGVEERSRAAGYELPEGVAATLGAIEPGLARGAAGYSDETFPWFTPGRITQDEGAFLQHHAFMPNNLVFNPDSLAWDVPNARRFPAGTGIWGAATVADWLPAAQPGFEQDYLRHLGYGAAQDMTSQSGANLFGVGSSGNVLDTSGYPWGTTGMGNQGWGNVGDMSSPNYQPTDYTSWYGGGGGGSGSNNNNWSLANTLDPNVGNLFAYLGTNEPAQPDFNATFGAVDTYAPGASSPDASNYFATLGLPSGDFGGGGGGGSASSWYVPGYADDPGGGGYIGNVGSSWTPPSWPTNQVGVYSYTMPSSPDYAVGNNAGNYSMTNINAINPNGILGQLAYGF